MSHDLSPEIDKTQVTQYYCLNIGLHQSNPAHCKVLDGVKL